MVKCDLFKQILRFNQEELKEYCKMMLEYYDYDIINEDGFLYGKGDIPIMFIAHLDTVHKDRPTEIYFDSEQGIMWSPQGIGGDDRCGIYTIIKLLKHYKPYILFLEDEEIGGLGASKCADKLEKPDVKFLVELDRRGRNDCVFYQCDNKEFKEYIQKFGFDLKIGTYTDICDLSPKWDIASVNLSIGYNNEHTFYETINVNYMIETFNKIKKILEDDDDTYFDFQEDTQCRFNFYYNTDKNKGKDDDEEDYKPTKFHKGNYYDDYGYIDDNDNYIYWDELKEEY